MKYRLLAILFLFLYNCCLAQLLPYTDGQNAWNADSLGNHRAVVLYNGQPGPVHVHIPWRRRDEHPEQKGIIVTDAAGNPVAQANSTNVTRECGDIYFEAKTAGKYFVYYMPFTNTGSPNYPTSVYKKPGDNNMQMSLPANATVSELQAVDGFNSFHPMEVIATAKEANALLAKYKKQDFVVFPEDRLHPIKMNRDLPYRWLKYGPTHTFKDTAKKGEEFAFQLGLYAIQDLKNVQVKFGDFKTAGGDRIDSAMIHCLNTGGITYDGKPFTKMVDVPKQTIQPLWVTVSVPTATAAGLYNGTISVTANGNTWPVSVRLNVTDDVAVAGGVNEPWKQTRLKWLNSTLAQENTVVAPYTPLKLDSNTVSLLGRKFIINSDGFPKQIQTFFNEEMTGYNDTAFNLLYEGIHFHFFNTPKEQEKFSTAAFKFIQQEKGTISWQASNQSANLQMDVTGAIEFDGYVHYTVKVTALHDVAFSNVNFHIPFNKAGATYFMGLGEKGGLRPDTVKWNWDVAHKNQDAAWIGNVNAGLYYNLRDENYVRPLNTNFYLQKPLMLPTSWGNDNQGGIQVNVKGSSMLADNFTGPRTMKQGDVLYYNFNLLITPFHLLNTDFQWENRFFHKYANLDSIKANGATVVNIHHATPINPWINYPFIEWKKMKQYIDEAHSKGLKVKIYNTVRELSNHAYELPALRSLGTEVYSAGKGGGYSWLQEHLDSNYIPAWFVPSIKDAAIINSGMNRWHNYYVEGMNWLTKNVGIDGVYLDDVAFDRITMKRIKRVLTQDGHPGIIDLHSANQYNKNDGFINSAILYMEHFPYLNRLWFGEYFDYEKNDPGFYLTEISGIPFGLMGEMLQGDGNPWRGMVYGMTSRLGWSAKSDPRPLWKAWDDFGLKGSKMIGYWSSSCPVKTSDPSVLATVFKRDGKAMLALASWADNDTSVSLRIDWNKLGIDASKATMTAPQIDHFQDAASFRVGDTIPVQKGKGIILIID